MIIIITKKGYKTSQNCQDDIYKKCKMQFTVKPRKPFSFLGKIRIKSNIFGYSNNKLVKDIKSQLLSLQQQIKHL